MTALASEQTGRSQSIRHLIAAGAAIALAAMPLRSSVAADTAWPVYGGTNDELHFSKLDQITKTTVKDLGLAWFHDLPQTYSSFAEPVQADGVLYAAYGHGRVEAMDAVSGKHLWSYDPDAWNTGAPQMRHAWSTRGIGYWSGKVYVGTQDGRLIALDAKSGKPAWSVKTTEGNDGRFIAGPPRIFDGKVIIGHGGADQWPVRGYVTAYDAKSGKQLWRFYTVPGNPADGFENDAMKMAAQTWNGEWWKFGGGGTVWHAITYDAKYKRIYLGTGNGAPWNHKIRSQGKGDNLFLCSIVALDSTTGKYLWHYQINPGESWDYNAAMDIELATLPIDGRQRDVILHAPKNGFFYVLDRANGKLISAEKIAKVTWAERIDLATGRPVETENVRYDKGDVTIWPGPNGAHSWNPMAVSPKTGFVYIPTQDVPSRFGDSGIDDLANWAYLPGGRMNTGMRASTPIAVEDRTGQGNSLLAWDPVGKREVWRVPVPGNAGVMATAGGLVFQGRADGRMIAYDADNGQPLWDFDARVGIMGAPISYSIGGKQYVSVVAGYGGLQTRFLGWDYREQKRRVLTFALNGKTALPSGGPIKVTPLIDPAEKLDAKLITEGQDIFGTWCSRCHGGGAIGNGTAPDLRASEVPTDLAVFSSVVHEGALRPAGMPSYEEFTKQYLEALRHYIRSRAQASAVAN